MGISLSIDKIVLEFIGVSLTKFMNFYTSVKSKNVNCAKGYVFNFTVNENEQLLFMQYCNFYERASDELRAYTLRVETSPLNIMKNKSIFSKLINMSEDVVFVSADIAYDIPVPLDDVFIISNDNRRKIKLEQTTRYFGKKHQRKKNGYCRVYNKKQQLLDVKNKVISHELSRIEIVHKPESRVPLLKIIDTPPNQSKHYFAKIINDFPIKSLKIDEQVRNLQLGIGNESAYIRREIKKYLEDYSDINFTKIANEQWGKVISPFVQAIIQ